MQARKRLKLPAAPSITQAQASAILEAYAHYPSDDLLSGWRLGIVVSRKAAPLAVQRNWLKRQIRTLCREQQTAQRIDLVFRAKPELKQYYVLAKQAKQLRQWRNQVRAEILAYLGVLIK